MLRGRCIGKELVNIDLKILHLSNWDMVGGAARGAMRLNTGLRDLGYDSRLFVANRQSDDPTVVAFTPPQDTLSRLRRRLRARQIIRAYNYYQESRPSGNEPFCSDQTQYGSEVTEQLPQADLINLHWIGNFVDYQAFFHNIATNVPIVWTLHDMNAFTGGCLYDDGCGAFVRGCGFCPQLGSKSESDLSHRIIKRKQRAFSVLKPNQLHVVTPSTWLASEAKRSMLLKDYPVTVIPQSVDTKVFRPRGKGPAREMLGIPAEAKVILFVADSVDNNRKGFKYLAEALINIQETSSLFLLSVGNGEIKIETGLPHLHLNHIGNDDFLSCIYSAADLFVIPSLQDNTPLTVMESMASGTPVIAFDVGGLPDMIQPDITGRLIAKGDVEGLRHAILDLAHCPELLAKMSDHCRSQAVTEWDNKVQARRYIEIYQKMLPEASSN